MGLLLGLFVLICGMVFTLGVLVGFGIGEKKALHSTQVSLSDHGKEILGDSHAERSPASQEAPVTDYQPGDTIRKAFRAGKQSALNEMEDSDDARPVSVIDTDAHFSTTEQGRGPASKDTKVVEPDRKVGKTDTLSFEKAADKNSVNSLFERSPASKDVYTPVVGLYTVQIASYSTEDEAQSKVRALRESGYTEAFVIPIKTGAGEQWFRVAVGSYKSKDWAKKAGDRIVKRRLASDFIIRQVD